MVLFLSAILNTLVVVLECERTSKVEGYKQGGLNIQAIKLKFGRHAGIRTNYNYVTFSKYVSMYIYNASKTVWKRLNFQKQCTCCLPKPLQRGNNLRHVRCVMYRTELVARCKKH